MFVSFLSGEEVVQLLVPVNMLKFFPSLRSQGFCQWDTLLLCHLEAGFCRLLKSCLGGRVLKDFRNHLHFLFFGDIVHHVHSHVYTQIVLSFFVQVLVSKLLLLFGSERMESLSMVLVVHLCVY